MGELCAVCRGTSNWCRCPDGFVRPTYDPVNRPAHYTSHPSGIETIRLTEHMGFCLGNVIKYVMRAPYKGSQLEDLKKAIWYIEREIAKLDGQQ